MQKQTILIGLPVSPCQLISQEKTEVARIVRHKSGGMAGGSKIYYGKILNEDEHFITFNDIITGETHRIGKIFCQEITDSTQLLCVTYDTTAHANYNKRCVNKRTMTQWFHETPRVNFTVVDEYASDRPKPIDTLTIDE